MSFEFVSKAGSAVMLGSGNTTYADYDYVASFITSTLAGVLCEELRKQMPNPYYPEEFNKEVALEEYFKTLEKLEEQAQEKAIEELSAQFGSAKDLAIADVKTTKSELEEDLGDFTLEGAEPEIKAGKQEFANIKSLHISVKSNNLEDLKNGGVRVSASITTQEGKKFELEPEIVFDAKHIGVTTKVEQDLKKLSSLSDNDIEISFQRDEKALEKMLESQKPSPIARAVDAVKNLLPRGNNNEQLPSLPQGK